MTTYERDPNRKRRKSLLARVMPRTARWRNRRNVQALAYRIGLLENQHAAAIPALSRASARRSDDQALHQITARRYRQFLDQDLMDALRHADEHKNSRFGGDQSRWAAEIARDICACLFALPIVAYEPLHNLLQIPDGTGERIIENLAGTARQLRNDVALMATSPWHFAFVANTHLDRRYQEPWGDCDPDVPVRWVVAPAYVAEGQVIVRQRVYNDQ